MKRLRTVVAAATLLASAQALAHGRLADISVYDRNEGRWLQVYHHEGRAYVVGKPGHEYQVRVANRLGEELLAVLSVDGVNVITGQTANPSQSGYVISPRATRAPAEIIALHYDSHANLLARGVVREPVYVAPAPRPFPGFVPDPRG